MPLKSLPADLFLHVVGLLEDSDRVSVLLSCKGWNAALSAAPRLMPTTVIKGFGAVVPELKDDLPNYSEYNELAVRQAAVQSQQQRARVLETAAALSPGTGRVKLTRFDDQPDMVAGVLALLPASLLSLELDTPCSGPVLAAAGRFSQLEQLAIPGNAAAIDWRMHPRAAVRRSLGYLTRLRLDCRQPEFVLENVEYEYVRCDCQPIPAALPAAVAAATRLERLAVEARWSPALVTLCDTLPPSLRQLELELLELRPDDDLPAMVVALSTLRPPLHLSLGLCTSPLGSLSGDEDEHFPPVSLPPLAGIRCLCELRLEGYVRPPPDWGQLTGLSALRLNLLSDDSLASLSYAFPNLTRLESTTRPGPGLDPKQAAQQLPRLRQLIFHNQSDMKWGRRLRELLPGLDVADLKLVQAVF
ncbi:F-box domain containing [Chlorella sorokiniana]|uniref:F-box domain containing n=1 Tax=Chlorella sorokiniana TaxID=3076 RepID=A0A2P6U3E4_CHLSO|nr:F-box domain containing [Chlorella sorokiniana]|eukprot:PRW60833.1 F-box domain containing [Chlorella sorokiniana]